MDTVYKDIGDVKKFIENLHGMKIGNVDIPTFFIPNWIGIMMQVDLGRKKVFILKEKEKTGLFALESVKKRILVTVDKGGYIGIGFVHGAFLSFFDFDDEWNYSHSGSSVTRLFTLILFQQLKEALFRKIIEQLNETKDEHNIAIAMARKAFEPFIPFLVADTLSK